MFIRKTAACIIACTLFASAAVHAAGRGPSTPEERKQALEYIHEWQADPLGPHAKDQFGWVLKWFADVPDLTVHVCTVLDKLPKGDKKDGSVIFGGEFMGQAAFVLENSDPKADLISEYQAGVNGALHIYESLIRSNPKHHQPYLDDLLQRRDAGTLEAFVKDRAATACRN